MILIQTRLDGAFIVELERKEDERGFFARAWSRAEFAAWSLNSDLVECSISFNHKKDTLRGMHYQVAPHAEVKLVRCTHGAIYDVVVDLRPSSRTFKQWLAVELTDDNRRALYIPEGFAHGFQTLTDAAEVYYQMTKCHHPESARGVRWDDPAFGIQWPPAANRIIAARDRAYPDYGL